MIAHLSKRFRFDSAHFLPYLPPEHKCRRMHGHSFEVEVALAGPVDERIGWVVDYAEISRVVKPLVEQLDHRLLNAVPGLGNPSSEVIAIWFWERLVGEIEGLTRITVFETCTTRCDYYGPEAGA